MIPVSGVATASASPEVSDAASVRVADYLRGAILRGDIAPGEWIRQEEVAERLGASRLPVREALRMLEAEGLTEHEPRKGARVPLLSQHEVDVIYQMRERLEPLALTESIPHLAAETRERLQAIQELIEANEDVGHFLELDREFHLLSYTGCQIDPLLSMVTRLWNSTQHYRRTYMALGGTARMWVVNAEHRLILDALERGDAVDAERHLSGHIRRTRIELDKHPEVFGKGAQ
jgi:DNA-binding GntR family transcriptional regulator